LSKLLIVDHFILNTDKDFLHGICWVPVLEHVELVCLNNTVGLVDTWQVNLGVEFKGWCLSWVVVTTSDCEHIDSIVKVGVWWPNDCTVPVCE